MAVNGKSNHVYDEDDETQPILRSLPLHKDPIWRQYFAALTASLISMGTGCVGGWSSSAVPLLMAGLATDLGGIEKVSVDEASWITSLINLGSLVGSLPAGQMSFYYGRRKFLLMLGVLLIIGWMFIIWNGNNVGFLYLGRFLCGFTAGSVCVALAMYSNEICCDVIRGRSGVFYDMMQVFGISFVYSVSAVTTLFWSSVICLCIPVVFLGIFYWMPESPLHCIKTGNKAEAIESIRWLHGEDCDVEKELSKIYLALLEGKELDAEDEDDAYLSLSIRKFFNSLSKTTIKAFSIILFLFLIQRSCGAPMVVYYSVDVFQSVNGTIAPSTATVFAGVSQFVFSASSLALVDRVGRRVLLITSFTIMVICSSIYVVYMALLSAGYPGLQENFSVIPVAAICLFVGIFRLGVGPIPWFLSAELVPIDAQRWALPTIFFFGWSISFIWSKTYLSAVAAFGHEVVFAFFIFVCLLGVLHTLIIPETKNKSRVEIQESLGATVSKYVELKSNAVIIIEN